MNEFNDITKDEKELKDLEAELKNDAVNSQEVSGNPTTSNVVSNLANAHNNAPKGINKVIIGSLSLLFLAGLIGGAYFLGSIRSKNKVTTLVLPTPEIVLKPTEIVDPIADWKTYMNNKYDFSLKYPNNFNLDSKGQTSGQEEIIELNNILNKTLTISLDISSTATSKSLYASLKNKVGQSAADEKIGLTGTFKNIAVDGITAYESVLATDSQILTTVMLEQDNYIFTFQLISNTPKDNEIFRQILSTTKFLDKTQTQTNVDTSSWNKYGSSEFVYTNNVYKSYFLMYPTTCLLKISSIDCKLAHGTATIIINAGGHGGEIMETKVIRSNEDKNIMAGSGKITEIEDVKGKSVFGTFWINKTDKLEQEPIFGFEFKNIPTGDLVEFESLFDQVLSTFKLEL